MPQIPEQNSCMGFLSRYELNSGDLLGLQAYGSYGIHKIVYRLFADPREGDDRKMLRILYADQGRIKGMHRILILSRRRPAQPQKGCLATKPVNPTFFRHAAYRFSITVNPAVCKRKTERIDPIKGRENIEKWFMEKVSDYGFEIVPGTLQTNKIMVDRIRKFEDGKTGKTENTVILEKASLEGILYVTNKNSFIETVLDGIGKGKAFGCGLLQIVPV